MDKKFAGKPIHLVIEDYSDTLIRLAFQYTGKISDAEHIVREVYKKLIKHRNAFNDQRDLKVWLIRKAVKIGKAFIKSQNKGKLKPLILSDDDCLAEVFKLNEEERIVLYLHDYEGFSLKEMEALLFIEESELVTILERTRIKLEASFKKEGVI